MLLCSTAATSPSARRSSALRSSLLQPCSTSQHAIPDDRGTVVISIARVIKRWRQADHYFAERQSELAASVYAKTRRSFEEVALKFINLGEKDALKR